MTDTKHESDQETSGQLALQRNLADVVAEYEQKIDAVPHAVAAFEAAGNSLKMAACIGGTWGDSRINTGSVYDRQLLESLLKSAWLHVYKGLSIERIASAADKRRFEQAMANPAPFTLDNIRATFGDFILNPRGNILRGLAEVFCDLDQAYKSHDKVRIGVKGLPKRVILSNVSDYGWGRDRLANILNALAAYQNKPLIEYGELSDLLKDGDSLAPARGVRLRRFANGNGHLFFEPDTLRDINMALAEYYGEVLPDCSEDKPDTPRASTAVSKDLQYYPTPAAIVERVMADVYVRQGEKVLEPSCGCGRFLDALRTAGAHAVGIEVDPERAAQARAKGHKVLLANFLETLPTGDYDLVVMNPPFYGKHYAKHVNHAIKFLKPGGKLTAILPATARYDHGLLDGRWQDLPVGSFSESGTNINTTVLTMWAPE
jgi:type I restriction-modification system DNA methylase subunit